MLEVVSRVGMAPFELGILLMSFHLLESANFTYGLEIPMPTHCNPQFIHCSVTLPGSSNWFFTCVYGIHDPRCHKKPWELFTKGGLDVNKPWCLTRNFNSIAKVGESSSFQRQSNYFVDWIEDTWCRGLNVDTMKVAR